jgi:hypothetical protein
LGAVRALGFGVWGVVMRPRGVAIRLRDHGPGEVRFEAILVADEAIGEWGSCSCEAVHRLVTAHHVAVEDAMREGHREVDAVLLLGDWEVQPGGELLTLMCSVLREPDRVPPAGERRTIQLSELSPQMPELAHWVLEQWRDARGLGS